MKAAALIGMSAALVVAVVGFAAGSVLTGYAAVGCGVLVLALAARLARPSQWAPAEVEHPVGRRHG